MADQQVTQPDGSVVTYDSSGHAIRQISPDGQFTEFHYRGDQYVATTGDQHVLYDSSGTELKQWTGNNESSAATYHHLPNGDYTLTDPTGGVTEYTSGGHLVQQMVGGQLSTFQYRAGGQYVATTGDNHVLYGADGSELKQWAGNDESAAARYHSQPNGDYTLTDAHSTTEYDANGHPVSQIVDGQTTTFQYQDGGQYVATTGNSHVLYGAGGTEIRQWTGNDQSQASTYKGSGSGFSLSDSHGTTKYTSDGRTASQTVDGQTTTFQYQDGGQYVATTGNSHVLYGADGTEIKQWTGNDESSAARYHQLSNGHFSLSDSSGTTEYSKDGHLVSQTAADGTQTTFQYRGDDYVATTGDNHVLYDSNGNEVKQWQGGDESKAAAYHGAGGDHYTLTDSTGTTEYTKDGHLVEQTAADGTSTTFQYRGDDYVATTGDNHVLYDSNGNEVKQWQGGDESKAAAYHNVGNAGDYTLTDSTGVTEYTQDGHLVEQTAASGTQTTFQYRGDDHVGTTGDNHVLYDSNGNEIKQWQGNDESKAATYRALGNSDYTLTDSQGTTEYTKDGQLVESTAAGTGTKTTYDYRGDDYVGTTGDNHVLYDSVGNEIKQWQGNDESKAATYRALGNGDYTLTDSQATTEYTKDGQLVEQTAANGTKTTFQYRGNEYVGTTGNDHVLYDADGNEIKQWQGADESKVAFFHDNGDGTYNLDDPANSVTTTYDKGDNHLVKQLNSDGSTTTFQYRGNEYVGTTGNDHVLYDADGNEVKQWEGADESKALFYHNNGDGTYTMSDPTDHSSTTYNNADKHLISQANSDGSTTTFAYQPDGSYIGTTGKDHVLYNSDGGEIKQWTGDDESTALLYHNNGDGAYSLSDPNKHTSTTYNLGNNHLISQINADGSTTTFTYRPDGSYVGTTGDDHVLYNSSGDEIKQWTGNDESKASMYHLNPDGTYTLTDPDQTITTYNTKGQAIKIQQPGKDDETIVWNDDGSYVMTQVNNHYKYNSDGQMVESWQGGDESLADKYTYNKDGTLTITGPDGTNTYGADGMPISGTFVINLGDLWTAIGQVQTQRNTVEGNLVTIKNTFTSMIDDWNSPAGRAFEVLTDDYQNAAVDVLDALDDGLARMRKSYQNYVDGEKANAADIAAIDAAGQKLAGGKH